MGDPRGSIARLVLASLLAGAAAVTVASPARADADADTRVGSWDTAAATLGTAGSLWEPTWTAELPRTTRVQVLADNLAFANGAVTAGDTSVSVRYGRGARSVWVAEKWADTGWAADPVFSTSTAKVETVTLRIGEPGMRASIKATVYANCYPQPENADPTPVPKGYRCSRADVATTGGYLVMTARPASTMTAPGDTSVWLTSRGVTFRELLRMARSVQQVAGAPTVAGSAQMVGMCRQMVEGGMTPAQASAFAQSNGYITRVGSIDGQPQAVTADYRPDRFTLDIAGGVVTGCTYG